MTVRKDIVTSNAPPKFPDQSTLIGGGSPTAAAPTQGRTTTDRFISEDEAAGTNVGPRVTAFDDATEIEVLTYSLRDPDRNTDNGDGNDDDGDPDTPSESDGHAASFDINEVTGQITVSARATLDADADSGPGNENTPYTVVVRAVDGDGDVENITVRIYVLATPEPPTIDRVYGGPDRASDRVPTGHSLGDRAPTEMSHYELDRTNADTATVIDTNLDTDAATTVEPATYYATDPEEGTITWSLAGDDLGAFVITTVGDDNTGASGTLAFASGPDFENPTDMNEDNVYKVTIVASAAGGSDELPVTVKVINSTDDNAPGSVTFSIRQPEVAQRFEAKFADEDGPISGTVKWQWYRAETAGACDPRTPTAADPHRAFIVDHEESTEGEELVEEVQIDGDTWIKIPDANGTGSTARYTPEAVFTTDADGNLTETHADDSDFGKCLRATFTYRDNVDRTYSDANDPDTDVDETLEGTWAAPEQPVKAIDENNEAPVFTVGGTPTGDPESTYRSRVVENMGAEVISEAFPAVDPEEGEDDATDDLLMYELSGRDATAFSITGTLADGTTLGTDDGTLTFSGSANYEAQREYRVTITATDPGGDSGSVDVIVDVSDVNERPSITMGAGGAYEENRTDPVSTFKAVDPEGSGITYSLQTDPITAADDTDGSGPIAPVVPADYADAARFEIDPVNGELTFKASPNFEDPDDAGGGDDADNMYQVVVRAEVADDTNPRHFATQIITVTVTNVNEAPMFSDTMQPLQITENPDDAEKEPPLAAGYLYLLNRGAGIPSPATPPAAPNLDVGLPVVAIDDDNNGDDPIPTADTGSPVQLPDAVKYELSGADAGYFDIVPATGQILTVKKLDYEDKKEFKVTVKASDVAGLYDTIDMTINVLDVDEVPVPDVLRISGKSSHDYEENGTEAVDEYTVAAGGDATPGAWTLEGADAGSFRLTGSGTTRMLEFRSPPDYDAEADADSDNMYEVTIKVTDSRNSDTYDILAVTVTLTDVTELGALSGSMTNVSVNEGDTDVPGTYTLTAIEDGPTVTWSLGGTDMGDFMLEGTGMSRMLKFSSTPDYETPMGGADNDSNTYMVTVMAKAGGEMRMVEVTVMVDNVDELGMLEGMESASIAEGTVDVGTYMASGTMADTAMWTLEGTDASHFMVDGSSGMSTMLKFMSAPDYESPMGGANDDSNTYMVTVMAEAGGEMDDVEVTITVNNVEEAGTVILDTESPVVDGEVTATLSDLDGGITDLTWTWETSSDMATWSAATGTVTSEGATSTYMPVEADAGRYLRATASYTDGYGTGNSEMSESAMVVAADVNVAPAFASETATRSIAENTAANTNIGAPVTATDQNGDTLTYSLEGTDAASFGIEGSTGQLSTSAALDYEDKTTYTVVVRATDPAGLYDTITVTISVTDVDEEVPAIVETYDTDGTPGIQTDELFDAIDDYFEDEIDIDQLFDVIDAYFASNG